MRHLSISQFRSKTDNKPVSKLVTWDELVSIISQHDQRPIKDGAAWSATKYKPGFSRGTEGVEYIDAIVLDLDCGVAPEEFAQRWEGLCHAVYSTHRHTMGYPKFRVVFPFKTPVPAQDWPTVFERLDLELVRGQTDPACKDASHIYYLPSCPKETWEQRITFVKEGEWLDPSCYRRAIHCGTQADAGRPGDDYNRRETWANLLGRYGAQPSKRGKDLWVRPGKDAKEGHSARTGLGDSDLMHVFSSNWSPFESGRTYSKFAALALLEHGGDFSAAARALAEQGMGAPAKAKVDNGDDKPRESVATKLVSLVQEFGLKLHCSDQGMCYAQVLEPRADLLRLSGPDFKDWLRHAFYQRHRKSANDQAGIQKAGESASAVMGSA